MEANNKNIFHRLLILQVTNILLFVTIFYLNDFFYFILGHGELIFKNINTVKSYERVLYRQVSKQIEPYVYLTIFFIILYQCYLLRSTFIKRRINLVYYILYLISFIISLITFLIIISGIFSMMTPSILG